MFNFIKTLVLKLIVISGCLLTTQSVIAEKYSTVQCTHDNLCPGDNKVICQSDFPKVIILGESQNYERGGGPRTCSFQGRRIISYSCKGGGTGSTVQIVSSADSGDERNRRKSEPVVCDGFSHSFSEYTGNPPYHVHWHLNENSHNDYNTWNSAQIIIH